MAGVSVLTRTKDGVIAVWQAQGEPIFAIYEGTKPRFCCVDSNRQERLKMLQYYLKVMEESFTDQNFEIRFYDEAGRNGKVTNADPYFGSLPFKVGESQQSAAFLEDKKAGIAPGSTPLLMQLFDAKLEMLKLQQDILHEKELALKDKEIEELEEELNAEPEHDDSGLGKIGSVTNMIGAAGEKYPWLQEPIKNLMGTINNFMNGAAVKYRSMTEPAGQMNGIPQKPEANAAIEQKLAWAQKTLCIIYREKGGVQMNENYTAKRFPDDPEKDKANKAAFDAADQQYVADMVKLAEIASTKPNTFDTVVKSLREM